MKPQKIIDFIVSPEQAEATSFEFTTEQYPLLAKCNAFAFVYKQSKNGGTPWSELWVNGKRIAKSSMSNQHAMRTGKIRVKQGFCDAYITGAVNISAYGENNIAFSSTGGGNRTPVSVGESIETIKFASYTKFLDEGGTIEVWGWNE